MRFDAFPELVLPALVDPIGSLAKGRLGSYYVREVPVFLELERTDPKVIPSLSASADVVLDREETAEIIPHEAVFVDDFYVNIEGCEKVGMKGIQFKDAPSTMHQLKLLL